MINILYVPSLNPGIIYWRIENYACMLVELEKIRASHKTEHRSSVMVDYIYDIHDNRAWDKFCVGYGNDSMEIQDKLIAAFKFYDVIIFQKIQNKEAVALLTELKKDYPRCKVIAELDDSIGEVSASNPYKFKDEHKWAAEHAILSDAIITSTPYLAESIRPIVGEEKPIHIAPNCINRDIWKAEIEKRTTEQRNQEFRVGYVGAMGHDEDLRVAYFAMKDIIEKDPSVVFVIRYGGLKPDYMEDHPQLDFKQVSWALHNYPQKLANLHIDLALAPLRDSNFNRCKSALKWLEWGALGVPLIASDVIPYRNHKHITLVRNDREQWKMVIRDRIAIIKKAGYPNDDLRDEVFERYNMAQECQKLLTFLERL